MKIYVNVLSAKSNIFYTRTRDKSIPMVKIKGYHLLKSRLLKSRQFTAIIETQCPLYKNCF